MSNRAGEGGGGGPLRGIEGLSVGVVEFPQLKYRMQVVWVAPPSLEELSECLLVFTGPDGLLVKGELSVRFEPEMPDMGHGTSPVEISKVSQGVYRASEIFYSMPGRWVNHISLWQGDQLVDQSSFDREL